MVYATTTPIVSNGDLLSETLWNNHYHGNGTYLTCYAVGAITESTLKTISATIPVEAGVVKNDIIVMANGGIRMGGAFAGNPYGAIDISVDGTTYSGEHVYLADTALKAERAIGNAVKVSAGTTAHTVIVSGVYDGINDPPLTVSVRSYMVLIQ